uniref:Uncharacterized protein n=1 Tax=Meleagris gallopavo TaxID=9103 RepID=A0A803Y7J1_MELGA
MFFALKQNFLLKKIHEFSGKRNIWQTFSNIFLLESLHMNHICIFYLVVPRYQFFFFLTPPQIISEVYHCAIIHGKINLMNVNPTFIKMIYLKLLCACAFDATLDVLSSAIVLWRYSNAAAVHSAHREYIACVILGVIFLLSSICIVIKAIHDLAKKVLPEVQLSPGALISALLCPILLASFQQRLLTSLSSIQPDQLLTGRAI